MEILTISGGSGLFGEVRIPGAKNSVLPIMAASVLCRGTVTLTDVPHLSDVEASARILQSVGCKVLLENGRAVITPPEFPGSAVPEPLMRAMRSSLFYLAPLLARTGRADIYTPGGCRLGARPIDMHLSGLEKMGAHITEKDGGALEVTAPDGLAGADIITAPAVIYDKFLNVPQTQVYTDRFINAFQDFAGKGKTLLDFV